MNLHVTYITLTKIDHHATGPAVVIIFIPDYFTIIKAWFFDLSCFNTVIQIQLL